MIQIGIVSDDMVVIPILPKFTHDGTFFFADFQPLARNDGLVGTDDLPQRTVLRRMVEKENHVNMIRHNYVAIHLYVEFLGDGLKRIYGKMTEGRWCGFWTTARVVPTNLTQDFAPIVGTYCDEISASLGIIVGT